MLLFSLCGKHFANVNPENAKTGLKTDLRVLRHWVTGRNASTGLDISNDPKPFQVSSGRTISIGNTVVFRGIDV